MQHKEYHDVVVSVLGGRNLKTMVLEFTSLTSTARYNAAATIVQTDGKAADSQAMIIIRPMILSLCSEPVLHLQSTKTTMGTILKMIQDGRAELGRTSGRQAYVQGFMVRFNPSGVKRKETVAT